MNGREETKNAIVERYSNRKDNVMLEDTRTRVRAIGEQVAELRRHL